MSWQETQNTIAFAALVTLLLFARSGRTGERPASAPGSRRSSSSLFQADRRLADLRARQRRDVLELLDLLLGSLFFAVLYVGSISAGATRRPRAGCCVPRATGAGRCSSARASTSRRSHHALADEVHAPVDMLGFISLTPRPDNGLRSLGRDRGAARGARAPSRAGGHHRRPGLPGGARGRARRPVPPARRDRARGAVDDGDPRAPGGVRPGRLGAALRAAPAGVRRLRLRAQADVRLRRRAPAAARAQPAA